MGTASKARGRAPRGGADHDCADQDSAGPGSIAPAAEAANPADAQPEPGDAIDLCLAGAVSPQIAIARLLLCGARHRTLVALVEERRPRPPSARWTALRALLDGRAEALDALVEQIAATTANHDGFAAAEDPAAAIAGVAGFFDHAALHSPEAGVALYSLGDPAILAAATAEMLGWLEQRGLLGPSAEVLDLGCGFGRVAAALAPRCRGVLGLDVSPRMVAEAGRRYSGLPNARFRITPGTGLDGLPGAAFDLVLAADSFPYIVQAGLGPKHVLDAARVLRPGGALVVLNLSYRGDAARDRVEIAAWAEAAGLRTEVEAERPFTLWDGMAWVYRLP